MTNLNSLEIRDLINRYRSELRKLEFQIEKTKETINGLQADLGGQGVNPQKDLYRGESDSTENNKVTPNSSTPTAPQPRRRGRPPKNKTNVVSSPKTTNTIVKAVSAQKGPGYRLSEWDTFIINSLEEAGRILTNSELFDLFQEKRSKEGKKLDDEQLRGKLNRSIHKLANKRGTLVKAKYEGKGFAYGLENWIDKNGAISNNYRR